MKCVLLNKLGDIAMKTQNTNKINNVTNNNNETDFAIFDVMSIIRDNDTDRAINDVLIILCD
jgi:hypothetical protein